MRRLLVPLVSLLLIGGFLAWWFSPTQVVKRHTKALLELLTMEQGTAGMSRIQGSFKLDRLLARKVEIEVPSIAEANGVFDKSEVGSAYNWLCQSARETRMKLDGIDSIGISGNKAVVVTSLNALVDMKGFRPVDGPGEATFTWQKTEDGWLLEKAVWKSSQP